MVKPVEFEKAEQPIHPYLIGYLIGNGSLGAGRADVAAIP